MNKKKYINSLYPTPKELFKTIKKNRKQFKDVEVYKDMYDEDDYHTCYNCNNGSPDNETFIKPIEKGYYIDEKSDETIYFSGYVYECLMCSTNHIRYEYIPNLLNILGFKKIHDSYNKIIQNENVDNQYVIEYHSSSYDLSNGKKFDTYSYRKFSSYDFVEFSNITYVRLEEILREEFVHIFRKNKIDNLINENQNTN